MLRYPQIYKPIKGKTYTLFGAGDATLSYYQTISSLASEVLEKYGDLKFILQTIQYYSSKKRLLKKIAAQPESDSPASFILNRISNVLNEYTLDVEAYIKTLPFFKIGDKGLKTTRLQYYLYMLEIELTNRLYAASFRLSEKKIALLPHCLRDFTVECKAAPDGFDYKCRHCSKICYQNEVSTLLTNHGIEANIWMGANLKKEAKLLMKRGMTLGVLGIACIPELVSGMRACQKYNLPVVGLPLDANRCIRWFGDFHENSVNLEMLEKLVASV
jgi:hypothetical protein